MKSIGSTENATDLKSQSIRSKLLSLSLVLHAMQNFPMIFTYPSPILFNQDANAQKPADISLMIAVRQYICLVFSRNVVNIVPQVFEFSMEIFGRMLLDQRALMKV
jgi:brefeldin A-inhibited guanine nucleotide-exchange protein